MTRRRSDYHAIGVGRDIFPSETVPVDVMVGDERKSLAAVNDVSLSSLFRAANQCRGDTIVTTNQRDDRDMILQPRRHFSIRWRTCSAHVVDGTVSDSVAWRTKMQSTTVMGPWSLAELSLDSALCSFQPRITD